ncbi:MAG TPA: CPBP family glutamic-type intramembrane protease [Steroidobacteraceae bacterium]|nr:CPBP family glutamic-type intramembrane protease [Steroidobacteraceae bacterium]
MTPRRLLLAFVLALPAAMLVAAVAAPAVQAALAPIDIFPLHRVFSRLTMLGVVLATAWLLWRYRLCGDGTLGYTGPWTRFLRRGLAGLLAGIALMALALVPLFLLDVRTWSTRAPDALMDWLPLVMKGLGSGLAVALIEETFFRGALQGSLQKLGAWRLALFAVPAYYAAVHFLGRAASVPYEEVNAFSGFTALAGFFSGFTHPLRIADAFIALWFVGLLLALVRRYWGDIAGCIGLHAGFVAIISLFRKVSAPAAGNDWSFLVGKFDGLLGLWIALLTGLCCLVLWRWRRPPP